VKLEKFWCASIPEVLETNVLMNFAPSEGSFIYEEGQEKLLAAEICEYRHQCRPRLRLRN
jgi:hypothetical protein